jgi:hypothetical protein
MDVLPLFALIGVLMLHKELAFRQAQPCMDTLRQSRSWMQRALR